MDKLKISFFLLGEDFNLQRDLKLKKNMIPSKKDLLASNPNKMNLNCYVNIFYFFQNFDILDVLTFTFPERSH